MTVDGKLAVIGLGSVGSMALWQAAQNPALRSGDVVGFEARTPGHGRSAVGGDSRLFRTTFREPRDLLPILEHALGTWRELEADSGQELLTQCGGLSIGAGGGPYIEAMLRNVAATGVPHEVLDANALRRRYPQHQVSDDDVAVFDPRAGFLRTDRSVLAAIATAEAHGAQVLRGTPVDGVHEDANGVRVTSGTSSWTFEQVIVTAGGWSTELLPETVSGAVHPRRIFLTWFVAREPAAFTPDRFPIFIRIQDGMGMYGTPSLDGATVKATLDGRSRPADTADGLARELTESEIAESEATVRAFLPGLVPSVVRSDAFPDLYSADGAALIGTAPGRPRTHIATGFSGAGFKTAAGVGSVIARTALGLPVDPALVASLGYAAPSRFATAGGPASALSASRR